MSVSFLRRLGLFGSSPKISAEVREAIDPFVQAVAPKLALLSNYRKVLEQPMSRLLDYANGFSTRIPEPLDLSLRKFTMDPRIGMFFASPVSLLETIDSSAALSEFFAQPHLGDEAYALLVMQRSEKSRFGMGNENGTLRADVLQKVVSFNAHRLTLAEPTPEAFAAALRNRSVQLLTQVVAAKLATQDRRRQQLEADRQRLMLRVEAARRQGQCIVIDGTRDGSEEEGDLDSMTAKLAAVESELASLKTAAELPNRLNAVAELIGAPEQLLGMHRASLHLDRMGIVQEEENANAQNLLCFEEVETGGESPVRRVVVPVRVTREAIRELEDSVACT
ncbi:hypothetical protein QU481_01805 [Crenobacter sp. SG2303]|uniref:Uncharacterized protein n=1 Tax=Crenobacter oryzisoli TaxID=3056844 RepID=A0ABT7XIS4_9NEIS|nr:hypothetical protein [Crenobacter sp. SG2303]MDN0073628.1 hypothetical protein [Crenobacter sp. SG2303]